MAEIIGPYGIHYMGNRLKEQVVAIAMRILYSLRKVPHLCGIIDVVFDELLAKGKLTFHN